MGLKNKIAVVTGATRGIGRATALRLARDGASVAVAGRDKSTLQDVVSEIRGGGGVAEFFEADFLKRDAVEGCFRLISEKMGPIDVLVNNAGQSARDKASEFWESDLDIADWMIDLNLRAAIYCTRQVAPSMRERRTGRIINIGSEGALIGSLSNAGYAAAKAGLMGFTRSLARELGPYGVNVNTVAPGYVRTRALDLLPPEIVEKAIANIPMGRPGDVEEIAGVISFFAGPDSGFVTGQCLLANGGRHMH